MCLSILLATRMSMVCMDEGRKHRLCSVLLTGSDAWFVAYGDVLAT